MADTPISGLGTKTGFDGDDQFPVNDGGTTKRVSLAPLQSNGSRLELTANHIVRSDSVSALRLYGGLGSGANIQMFGNAHVLYANEVFIDADKVHLRDAAGTGAPEFVDNIVFSSGKGIDFGASSGTNSTSEVLDDYEEGTFKPIIIDSAGNILPDGNHNYQFGFYTKIGQYVHCYMRVGILSIATIIVTNEFRCKGLPYTSSALAGAYGAASIGYSRGLDLVAAGQSISAYVGAGTDSIIFQSWDTAAGQSNTIISEIGASSDFIINVSYRI